MDEPEIMLCPMTIGHATLTEATVAAGGRSPALLVGFMFRVSDGPFQVWTASGSSYDAHLNEADAINDLRELAAQLLARLRDGK